jgi:hypothetical protein
MHSLLDFDVHTPTHKQRYIADDESRTIVNMTRVEQKIADELHRRAQSIVDRVVAEAMIKVREQLRGANDNLTMAG